MDYDSLSHLLAHFRDIGLQQKQPPTFMEITRYPHWENVASNVLEFYFNPNAQHGLGTLLLDALIALAETKVKISNPQGISVAREVTTTAGKRIDLLIDAYPDAVIVIENKIFHSANNDFSEYEQYAKRLALKRPVLLILLSLRPIAGNIDIGAFQTILYQDFCQEVLNLLGSRVIQANDRYLTFLLDFIQTIQNLSTKRQMNEEFRAFLKAHEQEIIPLLQQARELQRDMKQKTRALEEHLLERVTGDVKLWNYSSPSENLEFRETVGYEVTVVADFPVWIAADLTVEGWDIRIKSQEFSKGLATPLIQWLKARQINVSPHPRYPGHLRYGEHFPYDTDLSLVDAEVASLLNLMLKLE